MKPLLTLALTAALLSGCAFTRGWQPRPDEDVPAPRAAAPDAPAAEPTPRPFALPEARGFALRNGLPVSVVHRPHLPLATVVVTLRAGEVFDEPALPGLAALTGQLLKRGAGGRTAPQLAEAIDATGGGLEVSVGPDAATVALTVLKRDLPRGLALLSDVLTRPRLDGVELARLVTEQKGELEAALDDGDEVAALAASRVAMAGHPYGRPPSLQALGRVRRADVQRFYRRYWRPERARVFVVGDVDPDAARKALEPALGGWRGVGRPQADPKLPPAPKAPAKPVLWLVDMDVSQSYVRLVAPSARRADPDRVPLRVMNFILGGDFTSRLNLDIRDREGLAYGASSRFDGWREAGMFSARVNTRTETTRKAVDRLLANLHAVRDDLVTPAELAAARDHLVGAFPMRFETNADVAAELAVQAVYDLPADEATGFRARAAAVTAEAVRDVARRHVPADGWHLVVVGKAAAIAPQLAGLGEIRRIPRAQLVR